MGAKTIFCGRFRHFRRIAAAFAAAGLAAALAACAPSSEFKTEPQAGAWRGGAYPSFSQKPQAETTQLSAGDQARLNAELRGDGRRLRASAYADDKAQQIRAGAADRARASAGKEIDDTLKQIKGSGK